MEPIKKYIVMLFAIVPLIGFSQKPTSYDSDGDAIPDSVDNCLLVKGSSAHKGCPFTPQVTAEDKDGDGIANIDDKCVFMFGSSGNKGCPDLSAIDPATNANTDNPPFSSNSVSQASMFTTSSGTEQASLDDFKLHLTRVIDGTENTFAGLKEEKNKSEAEMKASVCLSGAKECFITSGADAKYFAVFGNYTDLKNAMDKFDQVKANIRMALGETEWTYTDNIVGGRMAVYDVWRKTGQGTPTAHVAAYVKKTENNTYYLYITVERDACCYASN